MFYVSISWQNTYIRLLTLPITLQKTPKITLSVCICCIYTATTAEQQTYLVVIVQYGHYLKFTALQEIFFMLIYLEHYIYTIFTAYSDNQYFITKSQYPRSRYSHGKLGHTKISHNIIQGY